MYYLVTSDAMFPIHCACCNKILFLMTAYCSLDKLKVMWKLKIQIQNDVRFVFGQ